MQSGVPFKERVRRFSPCLCAALRSPLGSPQHLFWATQPVVKEGEEVITEPQVSFQMHAWVVALRCQGRPSPHLSASEKALSSLQQSGPIDSPKTVDDIRKVRRTAECIAFADRQRLLAGGGVSL